ncbi:breast cancer type 1 susceptibility protein [Eublepharis macularius]|uniref:RING-type E3 ubiquitin transferase n=1 Tax=Eublepharis macularius TaxID=481883 RepID=A0AA97LB41_EUBMA|nr:breast cancer type 1 susceptibility protein [Eublepharis macularius]
MEEAMDSSGPGVTEVHGILLAMQKNLECPICLEVMKEPVSTQCAHVFCRFCILKLLEQKKGIRRTKCPLCNANITRRTLREDVRFKLVIKGIWEAIGALECDTGFNLLQEKQIIIESKGYRDRQNGAKNGEKRNRALQGKSSNLSLPNRTVTRCSLRKKSNANKTVCFEIGSDSSEDPFQKTGTIRCMGLRSSSRSKDSERHAEKRSRSPCHMELQEPSAEDVVLLGTPGTCGLSEARAGSTEGLQTSTGNVDDVEENAALEKRQNLSFPVPCMRRRSRRLVSSSTQEGGCSSLLGMEQYQLAGEATNSAANKQAGIKAETVSIVQPAGSTQICNLVCEDQQELTQPQASPNSPLSQVSGKKLKQSIQKVNEWFSKTKILSPTTLQDSHTEEGDPDLSPCLSDADSHVSQKTELREDQWEVTAECDVGRALPKPVASKMVVDKIFGRTYKRARKCNPIYNPRDIIHIPAEELCSAMNTKSCDTTIRKISALPKATLEQSSEDIMKKQTVPEDSEGPVDDVNAVLEEDGHDLTVVGETPGAELRAAELPVRERASSCASDASPISCHSCSLQNLKTARDSLSNISRRPVRQVCALQLAMCGSSGSPDKTQAQAHSNPSSERPREARTEEMHIRRSKRLMSRVGGEQRRSEPAEKRRKQLEEGEKKQKESQAENASPSLAADGPSVLQGRQAGLAGDASKACAFSDEKGSPSVEHPTESYNPRPIVPDSGSQASCSLLQYHLAEFEQTDLRGKECTVAPQAEQSALCAQAPEGNEFCLGDVKESCTTPRAIENCELNPGTEDSELDTGFMWKILHRCKRQSFLLYPAPVKKSVAGTQMDLSVDQVEGSEAVRVKKSNPGIDRVSEETGEAVTGRVANGHPGLSLISHPSPSSEHKSGSGHLQVASQALFPDSSCMPVAANEAKSGNPLWRQKPRNDKKESLEMEKTTNTNSCSCRSSGPWRSGNFLGTSLHPTDETRSKAAHCLEMRPNSIDNKALTCISCPELSLPVACQRCPSESSSGSVEKKSRVGEQRRLKGTGEQTVQMLSTGVSGGHLDQSPKDETPDFPLLSDTPEGLLGPATKSKGCSLNGERDQQETLAMFAETDQVSPHERDLECSSSSSGSRPEGLVQARRRRVQKLSSSSEENSSEDEELPCFQALVFGRSASTPSQAVKEEEEASADILAQKSSRQSGPRSRSEGGSPSQESECSVNLFSSQSCDSVESTGKSCDARPLTPVPTSQGKVVTSRTVAEPLGEISRDAGQLRDGHQDGINAAPNLGEALGYDSEASHLGDSSGFSSQSEILTTQQKDIMQNNLKKLQEEMAVLEAALKEGGQDAAAEGSPLPSEERGLASSENQKTSPWDCASSDGLPVTPESPVHTKSPDPAVQQGHEPGSASNLRRGSKQSLFSASSPAGNTHRTPDDNSTSSSTSQEHVARCLATKPERESPIAIQDKSSPPEHESQGRPVSSFDAATVCSGRKRKPKSLLLTSKRSMSLVASGLFPDELRLVQKFARKTRSTWSATISDDTTHVVMKTDEDLVCERTLKYFLGIAARKWVVSYQWILQSLKEGRVLNEGDFEVRGDIISGRNHQGPKKARESSAGKLFQGLEICCYGPFTDMQKEQLEWMVELCGASLVKQPHLFSRSTNSVDAVVVIQPDAWLEDTGCPGIPPPCRATVVAREWVLDSVSCYQCLAFNEYLVQQV